MAKTLVIVESPTKSKTIEKFLGKNYTVKASMGHLRDLPKSTLGVTFLPDEEHANEFEPKYINIRGKGDLIKSLKAEAKKADKVLLATCCRCGSHGLSCISHFKFSCIVGLYGICSADLNSKSATND